MLEGLPRRLRDAIVIFAVGLAVALVWELSASVSTSASLDRARGFLESHPTVVKKIGDDVRIVDPTWLRGQARFSCSPGHSFATYELRVVGSPAKGKARIRLEKTQESDWEVGEAHLQVGDDSWRLK